MGSIFKRNKEERKADYSVDAKGPSLQQAKKLYEADDILNVVNRSQVVVVGTVTSTRIVPSAKSYWFEVIIDDGTAKIDGWFFGRKEIRGIELGSLVLMKGLAQMDQGEMTIANPYYQIL
jgi:RecG-like helicase